MLTLAVAYIRAFFGPRHQLALEAAALRQQLAVLKRNQTHLRLHRLDRFFWTALRRVYSGWAEALIIVKPETVVSWHRQAFVCFGGGGRGNFGLDVRRSAARSVS
jgi:putative transposase